MNNVPKSATFSVRVERSAKKRLEELAKNTGRSRAFLTAQAINEYLDINDWQVSRIKQAIASMDAGKDISHDRVKKWIASWGAKNELPAPKTV